MGGSQATYLYVMPFGVYRETRHPNGRSELDHPASSTRTVIGHLLINGCQLSVDAAASRQPVTWLSPGPACSLLVDVNERGLRVGRRGKVELTGAGFVLMELLTFRWGGEARF